MDRGDQEMDYVIVGGGVAGLAAAIRLTELGIRPLVIESGTYPSHKVCGEYISPAGCEKLKEWGISPLPIEKVRFCFQKREYLFPLPKPAGALSHLQLDPQLAIRAKVGGSTIYVNSKVVELGPKKVVLENGEVIRPKHLLIATGRYRNEKPKIEYYGYKAHFKDLKVDGLEMHAFDGGYYGIAPIEGGKCNVACISRRDAPPPLKAEWLRAPIPEFGIKEIPSWEDSYFIGDAAGTIPPATGNGLTIAILSGILGAEYAFRNDPAGFRKVWLKQFSKPIFWGKITHNLLLKPSIAQKLVSFTPQLYQKIQIQ